MDPQEEAHRILEEIRRLIRKSGLSQRKVEQLAGFSKGYLSQLLARNLELKYWHVIAILEVLEIYPARFFTLVYPPVRHSALERFRDSSQPTSEELATELSRLYGSGIQSMRQLRQRMESCEKAISQLQDPEARRLRGSCAS